MEVTEPIERCIACFNDDYVPQVYTVQNDSLKTIFQTNNLSLCYICKRIAQNTEHFINSVQGNQLLLQSLQSITDGDIKVVKLETQPLLDLQNASTHTIDVFEDVQEEPFPILVFNRSKVQLKVEKEENVNNEDFTDNDIDYDEPLLIKGENESTEEVKFEDDLIDSIDKKSVNKLIKAATKLKKKPKIKRKECISPCDVEDAQKVDTVYITKAQFMKERELLAKKKLYLNSIYKCEDCVKGFAFKDIYEKHMKKHSETNGEYECGMCKQRCISVEKLRSHEKYHKIRYKCTVCGIMRVCRETIKCHYNTVHSNEKEMFSCSLCKRIFQRKVSLRKHMYYSHKLRRVTCDYCHKNYVNADSLRVHLLKKHAKQASNGVPQTKGHICPQCGKGFYSAASLRIHIETHSNTKNYYCVECNKKFKTEMSLKQHLNKTSPHVQYVELPLQCEHCDKRFGIKRDLERHMNRIHLNIKPFQCDKCDKAYVNQWSLTEHKRYTHEGVTRPRVFPCSMCDKVFMRNCTRKAHMRTHTGERPFKCTKCLAQFSQSGVLNTHMKLVHLKLTRDGRPKTATTALR
ncbi:unnamed protein product [Colias eurytheme]|nr:unnamed protein product [Colias eurytheme]